MLIKIPGDDNLPVHGLDFIGLVDRGTNLIEIKPTTLCNLRCAYCYANSGGYENEFEVDVNSLLDDFSKVASFKHADDIEAHIDPYGEALLYRDVATLVRGLKRVEGVYKASMQSNGTLLTPAMIDDLKSAGLDQINITLNAMDERLLKRLSGREDFNRDALIAHLRLVLETGIDLVITPVWFFGLNDGDIEEIIALYKMFKDRYGEHVKLGIQNYLVYKTGRKIGKIKQRDFSYFYKRLKELERQNKAKLLLGPSDFGIHPAPTYKSPVKEQLEQGALDSVDIEILSPGRQQREYIGRLRDGWGVKVVDFTGTIDPASRATVSVPARKVEPRGSLVSIVFGNR